jgi:nucleotide-binding universal stress UspA family protein
MVGGDRLHGAREIPSGHWSAATPRREAVDRFWQCTLPMKRILVALDGSSRSPAVLQTAIDFARSRHETLTLFRSVGIPADIPQDLWKATDEPLLDVMRRRAEDNLRECAHGVPKELLAPIDREVAVGVPWEAVCEAGRRNEADLLVIGSHGYGGLDRLLGTTAAKIVNHAPCSVLVVRSRAVDLAADAAGRSRS